MEEPNAGAGSSAVPPQKPAHVREFTPRAVIAGLLVAAVIGASYPYVVLKLGFGPNISVVSAFFGFLALGLFSKSYNRWENNLVQTAGTAAGQIAFLCWLLAAFDLLRADKTSGFTVALTPLQTFLWLSTAGILGVLLAVPLRKHYIEDEKLPFPDGMAAGETLILLDPRAGRTETEMNSFGSDSAGRAEQAGVVAAGKLAAQAAMAMVIAMSASALVMLATARKWIEEVVAIGANAIPVHTGVGISISLLNLGSGMIIGVRICSSMLIGLLLSWVIAPGMLISAGVLQAGATKVDVLLWVMWPATGLLVAGGLTALLLKWRSLVATFQSLRGASVDSGDFPMRWVVVGSLVSGIALIAIQKYYIGTPIWQSVLAIALTIPLMLVAMRVLGETNWGPISTMTNVMQALFGALAPGDLKASMVSSGITGSVAAESEGLMQDYKTGHMIGSTPRRLTYMQLMAVPVGALVLALIYPTLIQTYGLEGMPFEGHGGEAPQLSSPISQRWVGFAKILTKGFSALPPSALWALAIAAVLGVLLTVLEQKKQWRHLIPSPTGIGIGMLVPASAVATMFLGALLEFIWRKTSRKQAESYSIPVASGLIAGEAIIAVLLSIIYATKLWAPA
ncbi:MAG: OPT/YSL family transporter [Planctomycetes bacterium]|nr:OPT/YSL family transporter [Planctomycetota bacterium]